MDPNLFRIDGEQLFEVLVAIIVLSFFVERALAIAFENRWFVEKLAGKGLKEVIAFALAFAICRGWDFDAVSVVILAGKTNAIGHAITAAVIAGGSKASIKLFQDVFGAVSNAQKTKLQHEKQIRAEQQAAAASARQPEKSVA